MIDDIIKEYGEYVIQSGSQFIEKPKKFIPVSPAIDSILGGGIMEGCVVILTGNPKCGKDQPLDSIVMTPSGPKKMGDLQIGDMVSTPNGEDGKVIGIYPQGIKPVYKVTFSDGDECLCGRYHLWKVFSKYRPEPLVLELKDLIEDLEYSDRKKWRVELPKVCGFENTEVPIDPYLLGLLIGDGGISGSSINFYTADDELLTNIKNIIDNNHKLVEIRGDPYGYRIISNTNKNKYMDILRELSLFGLTSHHKFIPNTYKYNSIKTRTELLQGLMDTDGTISKTGCCSYTTVSKKLALDIKELVQSLGGLCKITKRSTRYNGKTFKSYRLFIKTNDNRNLFKLSRKIDRAKSRTKKNLSRGIEKIEFVGDMETQCIMIDHPDHLYMTDNFIVTHNTTLSLHFAGNAQKDGREIYYLNAEGRLKTRDLKGIATLDQDKINVIGSYNIDGGKIGIDEETEEIEEKKTKGRKKVECKTKILCAEDYLKIAEHIARTVPRCVIIIDSVGQLCSREEFDADVDEQKRAPVPVMLSRFTKKMATILPVNNSILILITHLIANTGGGMQGFSEAGGRKIAYAVDIKMRAKFVKKWTLGAKEDSDQIGQIVTWETGSTALLPPGRKVDSYIRYGMGIDELCETINLGKELGFIDVKKGGWTTAMFMQSHISNGEEWDEKKFKAQGEQNFISLMNNNPEWIEILKKEIGSMFDEG